MNQIEIMHAVKQLSTIYIKEAEKKDILYCIKSINALEVFGIFIVDKYV